MRLELFPRRADIPSETDFPVVDANIESAAGVVAHPRLVHDRSPVTTVVRKGEQNPLITLQAFC